MCWHPPCCLTVLSWVIPGEKNDNTSLSNRDWGQYSWEINLTSAIDTCHYCPHEREGWRSLIHQKYFMHPHIYCYSFCFSVVSRGYNWNEGHIILCTIHVESENCSFPQRAYVNWIQILLGFQFLRKWLGVPYWFFTNPFSPAIFCNNTGLGKTSC